MLCDPVLHCLESIDPHRGNRDLVASIPTHTASLGLFTLVSFILIDMGKTVKVVQMSLIINQVLPSHMFACLHFSGSGTLVKEFCWFIV